MYKVFSVLNIHWKDWCWSWNSNTLATWCEEPTHWKRPWCWARLKAEGEWDREWDGWMASPTRWTWVWASSRRWWWEGKPDMLQSMGLQRVGHDWSDWTKLIVDCRASQVVLVITNLPANAGATGDSGLIPGLGRSPGGGHGNPLECSCLENPMDRGAWWAIWSIGLQRVGHDWSNLAWHIVNIVTMLYIISPEPSHLITESLYPFTSGFFVSNFWAEG